MEYVMETQNLTKRYQDVTVVNQVNLHVPKGKIYGLLGRNGAGKTTIMKMMLQLVRPTKGNILMFGKGYQEQMCDTSYYAFEILYWCGIREGELLALTPADFDFDKAVLRINKSYQRIHGEDVVTTPKTKKSNRMIKMPKFLCEEMKDMMEMVCETDSLDRDLQDSITELNIISEQMQIAIAENSRAALDQDEYEKRYAELTARYEKSKAKYDDIAEQIESKKAKRELFKGFIRTLEKQDGLTCEFDAGIWSSLVQEVVVKAKDDIRFIFKNGFEVRV